MRLLFSLSTILILATICRADALDTIIAETASADPSTRIAGYEALVPYLNQHSVDPRAIQAVTALLVLETSEAAAADNDADYYSDLIQSVTVLHDPLTIPALVGVIGSGNLVPRSLAVFGSQALDAVIARSSDEDWIVRKCVMITLANMLQPANFAGVNNPASLKEIAKTLAEGVLDTSPFVASSALYGLQSVPVSGTAGDVNGDGVVNCLDLALVKASFGKQSGQPGFDPRADVNHDGTVNVLDLQIVASHTPAGTTCQ